LNSFVPVPIPLEKGHTSLAPFNFRGGDVKAHWENLCNYKQLLKRLSDKPWPSTSKQRDQRLGFVGEKDPGWEGWCAGTAKPFVTGLQKKKKKKKKTPTGISCH
jgi:hypothetical protein